MNTNLGADELRSLQLEGSKKISAQLILWRDEFVATLGQKVADRWLQDAIIHLEENGILVTSVDVPPDVLERYMSGDYWGAFGKFSNWLDAKRGILPWRIFWDDFLAERPAPRDIVLMMAIANGIGKAERLLNEKESKVTAGRAGRQGKLKDSHDSAVRLFRESRPGFRNDSAAIAAVIKALSELPISFGDGMPDARTVRRWLESTGDINKSPTK